MVYARLMCTLTGQIGEQRYLGQPSMEGGVSFPPQPARYSVSLPPKLGLIKIPGACDKACPVLGFILLKIPSYEDSGTCVKAGMIALFVFLKIGFYEDFRYLRQNLFDVTQHMVMPLPENLRHLQAGDGGDREGPAKKKPHADGWAIRTGRRMRQRRGSRSKTA